MSISDSVTPANSQTFTYDGLNRLVTAQSQAYNTINISYDLIGNIQTNADSGNPADRNGEALTYDFDNRVTGINATSFAYDYTGARVKKTTGASITTYVSKLYDITNGTITKHIFAGGTRIASKTGNSIYYYHPDHLGSLSIATDASGTRRQTITYYPFGEVRTNTGTVDLPYKFTGHELDSETGLYYCGARYYDSAQGRFISPDTIVQSPGDPQTFNRYSYCRNNPLLYTDPSGHFFGIDDLIMFALAIGTWISDMGIAGAMIAGAALGASISAICGGNPLTGALAGAISGALFFGAGSLAQSLGLVTQQGVYTSTQALIEASLIHVGAGAASGAIGAAINHGNVGLGALTGGISAGVACGVGAALNGTQWFSQFVGPEKFFAGLVSQVGIGAVTGGITSEIMGGKFLQGMGQGAWTAAYGFLFNDAIHAAGGDPNASCGDWHVMGYVQPIPFAPLCWCYWLYYGPDCPALWGNNYLTLPSSPGTMVYTGGGGLKWGKACEYCPKPPTPPQ